MEIVSELLPTYFFFRIKLFRARLWRAEYTSIEYCRKLEMTGEWAEKERLTHKQIFLTPGT